MQQPSNFQVYNASAGSGKTFTLVKKYLKVLLISDDIFMFQKVLAITFTNKAAGEMKERVLENLETFSEGKTNDLLSHIIKETNLDFNTIQELSKKILDAILQNYSAFSITTIDSFTHKIIKSFAYDLGLSLNFEVEMDAISLLNEAVDILLSKIGTDQKLTKLLIAYTLDKTDDDKSWDISRDLNEFAKILLNEDDTKHFRNLADKQLDDFFGLKTKLQKINSQIEKEFKDISDKVLKFIDNNGLSSTDFSYGDYPKHFEKFQKLPFLKNGDIKFEGRLNKNIEEDKNLYGAKTAPLAKDIINDIKEQLHQYYYQSKTLFEEKYSLYLLNKLALKSITPLAVLNNINNELNAIKEDNNIRLNAEFNQLISDNIKGQPAPFIYERIGQRFMHYFIDEMQDTSELQWQNLIPLIDNALAQESSNLLLVGDGKQAIYRWRGGKAEQFIGLGIKGTLGNNPFQIDKKVEELDTNYRSYSEIINFNNQFFQHVANFLQNEVYKNIYIEGNQQKENAKKGGYVSLEFLEKLANKEDDKLKYPTKVFERILNLKDRFKLGEICVLTRTKKDGIAIADFLTEKGIKIVSSETLLLKNDVKIKFIINLLQTIQNNIDEESRFEILYFLHEHLEITQEKHQFIETYIKADNFTLFKSLEKYTINFELSSFLQLPFYEKIETIVRNFKLVNASDAYIQFFLDVVLEQQRKETSIQDFLDFWTLKSNTLSIVAPESTEAVQIMTIHKSKGLEFPVVIFPFDVAIYNEITPKVWLDNLPASFGQFKELLVDGYSNLQHVSDRGLEIFNQKNQALELDSFNLLYVTLTRAVEQLYIITDYKVSKNGDENLKHYSGVFINFLKQINLWNDQQKIYTFGNEERRSVVKELVSKTEIHQKFTTTPWQEHNIVLLASSAKLWNAEQSKAIDFGNLLHEIFSKIKVKQDAETVIQNYYNQGLIEENLLTYIQTSVFTVVNHPQLEEYFTKDVTTYNEREIVDIDNQVIIPDRLVFNAKNQIIIIDYKTGAPYKEHHQQLLKYQKVLETMNFTVVKKILIYINDKIEIVEV